MRTHRHWVGVNIEQEGSNSVLPVKRWIRVRRVEVNRFGCIGSIESSRVYVVNDHVLLLAGFVHSQNFEVVSSLVVSYQKFH